MLIRLFTAVCLVSSMSFVSQSAHAQKVANYDFTDSKPSERLRPPVPTSPLQHPATRDRLHPPPPPKPTREESGEGTCGGILQNPPLIVSLVSLDRDSYAFGDEFTFVVKLDASRATTVPVRASLAEVEPVDANMSYEWRPFGISLELRSLNYRTTGVGLLRLYGSKDTPGSEIELKPGEWIELRGMAKMEWSNLPHGALPPDEEKYVLPLPLRQPQEFMAAVWASRGEGYRFDAGTREETRVCHVAEQSSSGNWGHVTVRPTSIQSSRPE
jgi:hypothetical protein